MALEDVKIGFWPPGCGRRVAVAAKHIVVARERILRGTTLYSSETGSVRSPDEEDV